MGLAAYKRYKSPMMGALTLAVIASIATCTVIKNWGGDSTKQIIISAFFALVGGSIAVCSFLFFFYRLFKKTIIVLVFSRIRQNIIKYRLRILETIWLLLMLFLAYKIQQVSWLLAVGIAIVPVLVYYYFYKPVKIDRLLYGNNTTWMIFLFSVSISTIFCIFSGFVSCVGGNISEEILSRDTNQSQYEWWALLTQFTDPGNLPLSKGIWGRFAALLSAILGLVLLSGFFVSSIVNALSRRANNWKNGLIVYNGIRVFNNYVIIIGVNEQTASIVRQSLHRDGVDYVLIQTRKDVEKARLELELKMDDELEDRIVFYAGERTSAEDIQKLQLQNAKEIFILGEYINDPNEIDHDANNVNTLEHISKYVRKYREEQKILKSKQLGAIWLKFRKYQDKRIKVHVDFEYQSTFTAFKATHLYQRLSRDVEFIPFNVHEIWAKKIFVDNFAIIPAGNKAEVKVQRYFPIDTYLKNGKRVGITENCKKTVHLIIFGMNQMGTALATQAALLCHFPNFAKNSEFKTTITFIDDHAKEEAQYFMGRYSELFNLSRYRIAVAGKSLDSLKEKKVHFIDPFQTREEQIKHQLSHLVSENETDLLDIQWEFIQGNVASPTVQKYINDIVNDPRRTVTVAICFNRSEKAQASAMYLPKNVFKKANQVLVYQQNIFDLINDVSKGDSMWNRYEKLFPFGMIESSYIENPYENILAKLDYCFYRHPDIKKEIIDVLNGCNQDCSTLLDKVDGIWNQVGIIRKIASIDSVESIQLHLRSMNRLKQDKINQLGDKSFNPTDSIVISEHMRWMTQRLISGFRPFSGPEQNSIPKDDNLRAMYINELQDKERAHIGICSFSRMQDVAPERKKLDSGVIKDIPFLLRGRELISILRLNNPNYFASQHQKWLKSFFRNDGNNEIFNSFLFVNGLPEGIEFEEEKHCKHNFWMSDTVVTQEQWYRVMGKETKKLKNKNNPIVNISKQEVDDFLDILRKRSGLYFELPSIKEWNVAAERYGGQKSMWHIKKDNKTKVTKVREDILREDARYIHHLLGNVWEWTHTSAEHQPSAYCFCGGSFRFGETECNIKRPYYMQTWDEKSSSDDLGFRLIWKFDLEVKEIKSTYISENDCNQLENVLKWFSQKNHKMKLIKEGFFVMGTNKTFDPTADENEMPRHSVKIENKFYICQVPVTQSLWNAVYEYENIRENPTTNRYNEEFPQTDVSWDNVQDFLEKLNNIFKNKALKPQIVTTFPWAKDIIEGNMEFRLPTEAEWEYAAKGGNDKGIYESSFLRVNYKTLEDTKCDQNNEIYLTTPDLKYPLFSGAIETPSKNVAWYNQPTIHEVAQKLPNNKELYDMSGNVWEWCYDFYIFDMYSACKIGKKKEIQNTFVINQYNDQGYIVDPIALDGGFSAHVFRGGSWKSSEWDCRCTRANFWNSDYKSNDLGFRLVLGKPINKL